MILKRIPTVIGGKKQQDKPQIVKHKQSPLTIFAISILVESLTACSRLDCHAIVRKSAERILGCLIEYEEFDKSVGKSIDLLCVVFYDYLSGSCDDYIVLTRAKEVKERV